MIRFLLTATIWLAASVSFVGALYLYRFAGLARWKTAAVLIASVGAALLGIALAYSDLGSVTAIAVGIGAFGLTSIAGISYVLARNFERKQLRDHFKQDSTNYAQIERHWLLGWFVRRLEQ